MIFLGRHFGEQAGLGLFLLLSTVLLLLAVAAGTGIGEMPIPLDTTFFAVTNRLGWTGIALDPIHQSVIWDYRLSRALVAALRARWTRITSAPVAPLRSVRRLLPVTWRLTQSLGLAHIRTGCATRRW